MRNIYENVVKLLKSGESIVLALLIADSGSTPREAGAKMIIRGNGKIIGTIGGGLIEAKVQRMASDLFRNKKSCVADFDLTADGIASIGMICGGKATVFLQYIDAFDINNRLLYQQVVSACSQAKKAWLVIKVLNNDNRYKQYLFEKSLVPSDPESEEVLKKISVKLNNKRLLYQEGHDRYIVEPLVGMCKAFVFGGGHVGFELVPVLSRLGFYTVVIDDRKEFSNKQKFPNAQQVITDSFNDVFEKLPMDNRSFIVIVTRGHMHDYSVLTKALRTDAHYIGMIGSRKKWETQKAQLINEGFTSEDIARVHTPIGLKINAETPEEIAISIAGEMILSRSKINYY